MLLIHKANVNATNCYKNSALMTAIYAGNDEIVRILIHAKADVNVSNTGHNTPMLAAANAGYSAIVQMLREAGADPNQAEITSIDQGTIISKISRYLQLKNTVFPEQYKKEDIEAIIQDIDPGLCNGLSAFWLWYNAANKGDEFITILKRIAKWNGKDLTPELNTIFEDLINAVYWLQCSLSERFELTNVVQQDLPALFKVLSKKEWQTEFKFTFVIQPKEIKTVLEQSIFENKMILLGGLEHGLALMKKSDTYYLYNASDVVGVRAYQHLDLLTIAIQEALGVGSDNITFEMRVFSATGTPVPEYPKFEVIMNQLLATRKFAGENMDPKIVINNTQDPITSFELLLENNDVPALSALIDAGGVIVAKNAISKSIQYNVLIIILDLIKQGFDINYWDLTFDTTQLLEAIKLKNNLLDKNLLLNEESSNVEEPYNSPLMQAIYTKNMLTVKFLLDYCGAKITHVNENALLIQALLKDNVEIFQLLISSGANVTGEFSPLLLAIKEGKINCAKMLLESTDLNQRAIIDGTTPLMYALEYNQLAIAEMLLAKGVAINVQATDGRTALTIAKSKGNQSMVEKLLAIGAEETPKLQMTWKQEFTKKNSDTTSTIITTNINLGDLPPSTSAEL
jgi:ankyrin repeat protein